MDPLFQMHIEQMEKMTLADARKYLATKCGDIGSPNYNRCLVWLEARSETERDERQKENLEISLKALHNSERATRIAIFTIILNIIMAASLIIIRYDLVNIIQNISHKP